MPCGGASRSPPGGPAVGASRLLFITCIYRHIFVEISVQVLILVSGFGYNVCRTAMPISVAVLFSVFVTVVYSYFKTDPNLMA